MRLCIRLTISCHRKYCSSEFCAIVLYGPGKIYTQFPGSMEREMRITQTLTGQQHQVRFTGGYDVFTLTGRGYQSYGCCFNARFPAYFFRKWGLIQGPNRNTYAGYIT